MACAGGPGMMALARVDRVNARRTWATAGGNSGEGAEMDDSRFDTMARALGRDAQRRALLRAGASALGALGVATLGADRGNAKQGGNKGKCQKQVKRCRDGLAEFCATAFPEPAAAFGAEECAEAFGPCCLALGGCNAAQGFACAAAKLEELREKKVM
jgi:hypothetical protein